MECKMYIKLCSCPAKDAKCEELDFGRERSELPEYNATFGTLRMYGDEDAAKPRAVKILDDAIAYWKKRGYALRCAPKTVDDEHHNWRRIARVGKPGNPSVCLQVVIDGLETYFDPWMY
jgi:hypothetical protein